MSNGELFRVQSNQDLVWVVTSNLVVHLSAGINHRHVAKTHSYGRNLPKGGVWKMGVGAGGLSLEYEFMSSLLRESAHNNEAAEKNT